MFFVASWSDVVIAPWFDGRVIFSNIVLLIIIVVNVTPYLFIFDNVLIIREVWKLIISYVGVIGVVIICVIQILIILFFVHCSVNPIYILVVITYVFSRCPLEYGTAVN